MRWHCPHCGTTLAAKDEKLGTEWSFARCYRCAGFSMVRSTDQSVVKIEKAPEDKVVHLPESHELSTAVLSQNAATHLKSILEKRKSKSEAELKKKTGFFSSKRPTVASRSTFKKVSSVQPGATKKLPATDQNSQSNASPSTLPSPEKNDILKTPPPLEAQSSRPERSLSSRVIAFISSLVMAVTALAVTLAVAVGFLSLYMKGNELWQGARNRAAQNAVQPQSPTLHANSHQVVDQSDTKLMAPERAPQENTSKP